MDNNISPKLSGVMVVYNEGLILERAIKSIIDLVDELIIVHDGKCSDDTLLIAKKYTKKVYVLPHIGEAEPHRPFTYEKAKNNLILQIDADEYITEETSNAILLALKGENVSSVSLKWTQDFNNKKIALGNKLFIFDKQQYYFIGIPHEWPKKKTTNGKDIYIDQPLYNAPLYDNSSWKAFKTKWLKWCDIHAKYLSTPFSEIKTWNYDSNDWDFPNKYIIKYPLCFGMPYVLLSDSYKLITSISNQGFSLKASTLKFLYRVILVIKLQKIAYN